MKCTDCGYNYRDIDEDGNLIGVAYCHYDNDDCVPCEDDEEDDDLEV